MSLSSRRAWIEITPSIVIVTFDIFGRSPHGERGLKFVFKPRIQQKGMRRSPHGERGLKLSTKEIFKQWKIVALLTESVD